MTSWKIKGQCENCGFAYKGPLSSKSTSFPSIKCPNCHKETFNFDEDYAVDRLNKEEGSIPDYKESTFEIVG
jgi:hypothetical protein